MASKVVARSNASQMPQGLPLTRRLLLTKGSDPAKLVGLLMSAVSEMQILQRTPATYCSLGRDMMPAR